MKAAVVTAFGQPPRYAEFPAPAAGGEHDLVVDVLAAGLHERVRSQASGSHYTSTRELPLVPGIDGVGRGADGELRYFVLGDTTLGTMAEQTLIDVRRSVMLPPGTDPVAVAAAMNPAMSSWLALRYRAEFRAGQDVLILGATGGSGRLAVQVARMFGARKVIAAGRDPGRLAMAPELGADETVSLAGPADGVAGQVAAAAADVDVVLDYLWGEPAAAVMAALVTARGDRGKTLHWVSIGAVAGPSAAVPSVALRATDLRITGSGQGSVGAAQILSELPSLAEAITAGSLGTSARVMPLADVTQAWEVSGPERIVLMP